MLDMKSKSLCSALQGEGPGRARGPEEERASCCQGAQGGRQMYDNRCWSLEGRFRTSWGESEVPAQIAWAEIAESPVVLMAGRTDTCQERYACWEAHLISVYEVL